jgi:hypothetical protein
VRTTSAQGNFSVYYQMPRMNNESEKDDNGMEGLAEGDEDFLSRDGKKIESGRSSV